MVDAIAFDSQDKWMIVGVNYYLDIYSTDPWNLDATKYQQGYKPITDIAFSADEESFVTAGAEAIMIYHLADGTWSNDEVIDANGNTVHVSFSDAYLAVAMGDYTI